MPTPPSATPPYDPGPLPLFLLFSVIFRIERACSGPDLPVESRVLAQPSERFWVQVDHADLDSFWLSGGGGRIRLLVESGVGVGVR